MPTGAFYFPEGCRVDMQALIAGLNEDLAHEFGAIIQYNYQAAVVAGPFRSVMRAFFQQEMTDELNHAKLLADHIVALGGTPSVEPKGTVTRSDLKGMLEANLKAEEETLARYRTRIEQAEAVGAIAVKLDIENLVADETKHADELRLLLRGL